MTTETIKADLKKVRQLDGAPTSFKLAGFTLLNLSRGRLDVVLPDGRTLRFEGSEPGAHGVIIAKDLTFARQVLSSGDIGFAEAYMDDAFDTPDLTAVLEFFTQNFEAAGRLAVGGWIARAFNKVRHVLNRNSKSGSKRNILAHYDLGNSFYERWLDKTMTYSSATFESPEQPLQDAQLSKYRRIAESVSAQPDAHILEIGSGWGGFAEVAAKEFGAKVTSVTISDAQHEFASKRMFDAGLAERVDIQLRDYRDIDGKFDGIASIEMFEAVGEQYWPSYFGKVADALDDNGRAAFQIITIDDELFDGYRKRADFIQRFIFPGGMLPSIRRLEEEAAAAGLAIRSNDMFGASYAKTLAEWSNRFNTAWDEIKSLGFDERFRRLWHFYLAYCEAGFKSGRIDVGHFVMGKP